ncbi:hypothetical protein KP509_18G051600 [Ceratopteris richardii]|uniref:Uncharacterized protein n=2 Tax=Ceratopteris richardii TaxID=49495 RepID=A0A8T2SRL1_CERRI|nr:hypothetical protein KP509_18G051600 [Ceratopteris richardii]
MVMGSTYNRRFFMVEYLQPAHVISRKNSSSHTCTYAVGHGHVQTSIFVQANAPCACTDRHACRHSRTHARVDLYMLVDTHAHVHPPSYMQRQTHQDNPVCLCMYTEIHIDVHRSHMHSYGRSNTHICPLHVYVHINMQVHAYAYIYTYTYKYISMFNYPIYTHARVHTCTCTCTCTCMHKCIDMHVHT